MKATHLCASFSHLARFQNLSPDHLIGLDLVVHFATGAHENQLGAPGSNVTWMVMREVLMLAAAGICIAVPAALGLIRLVRSQLYGVIPNDPVSIAVAVFSLTLAASLAGYLPARRPASIDPIQALPSE